MKFMLIFDINNKHVLWTKDINTVIYYEVMTIFWYFCKILRFQYNIIVTFIKRKTLISDILKVQRAISMNTLKNNNKCKGLKGFIAFPQKRKEKRRGLQGLLLRIE